MTPLAKKLRIQQVQQVLILNAPEDFIESLGPLPEGAELFEEAEPGTYDYVHLFVKNAGQYAELGPAAIAAVKHDGVLWVSYPKKSSGVDTDLSRNDMWDLLGEDGWRPVSQVSIDAVWSAVRFRPNELVGT